MIGWDKVKWNEGKRLMKWKGGKRFMGREGNCVEEKRGKKRKWNDKSFNCNVNRR